MAAADETTTGLHIEEATGPEDPAEEQLRTGSSAMEIEGGGLVLNPHKKQKKTASTNQKVAVRISPAHNQFLREAFEKEGGHAALNNPMGKITMTSKLSAAFAKAYTVTRKDDICTQERFTKLFARTPTEADLAIQVQKAAARKLQSANKSAAADALTGRVQAAEEYPAAF